MKERINDEWNTTLSCVSFLWMLAAAVAATTTPVTPTTTSFTRTSAAVTATAASAFDSNVAADTMDEIRCPAIRVDSCSCYVFDDDVYLECPSPTMVELREALAAFADVPVRTLSVYNLDKSATTIKAEDFARPLRVRQLHISLCAINQLTEDSFRHVREHLESLAIVSGKLRAIPRKTLPYMTALRAVSFEANEIAELPDYSFYGLRLVELNLKGNALSRIGENAFAGLEETLELADLSANRLTDFPTAAVRRLRRLATLRLAWNVVRAIPDDGYSLLESLRHVDLGCNRFASVGEDAFRPLARLRTLSLYNNGLEVMHGRAFASLTALESIDLSHNQLVHVEADTFRVNLRLETIDLSHNHVHRIDGLFAHLVRLRQLFLGENNVLAVPRDAFANATALDVLHLQRNAVRHIDERAFPGAGLTLRQLRLSENFVQQLPTETLVGCADLVTLSLDHNAIVELEPAALAAASALRELRLHNNRIERIRSRVFEPLRRLVELHLQHNAIATIERGAFGAMRSLQYVNLRGNALRELGDVFWPHAASLVSVRLDANRLTTLDTVLAAQTAVETVRLSRNQLTRLEYAHLTDLRSARHLYVADNLLASIEDGAMRAMGALLALDLSANRLRVVSAATFAGLDALRELRLPANRLEAIADDVFARLGQLRLLDLSGNRLNVLRAPLFHPNAPLERLLLRDCQLIAVDRHLLTALRRLDELDLRANRLADDAVVHLRSESLRVLDLSANNLTRLPIGSLEGLPALRELRIEDGRLALIESGALLRATNLESFSVRRNRLRQLPDDLFRTARRLRSVRLDENLLTALPRAVADLLAVRQLSVAANRIGDTVDVCAMRALHNLTELNLSSNAIATLTGLHRCNLTRLVHLDLSANRLTALPEDAFCGAVALRSVDLSANRFTRLPLTAFARCRTPGVERLVFENNPISRISGGRSDAAAPPSPHTSSSVRPQSRLALRELIVGGCANLSAIDATDLDPFDRLARLLLAGNAIARISPGAFRSLPALTTLDLGDNRIASLPPQRLRGLRGLQSLNLTRNALSALHPFGDDLKALRTLDLSRNRLVAVDRLAFRHLVNLTELRLQGNRIASISADAFVSLRNLRALDIASNEMRFLPLEALKSLETRLRSLILGDNKLLCGCAQEETWEWLRDHEKMTSTGWSENKVGSNRDGKEDADDDDDVAISTPALRCEEPAELRGRLFLQTEPFAFCVSPLLIRLAVRDIRSASVNVSWEARDYSHLRAYRIVRNVVSPASSAENGADLQHSEDMTQLDGEPGNERGSDQLEDGAARWALVTQLVPNTRYSICVIGLGDEWQPGERDDAAENSTADDVHYNGDRERREDRAPIDGSGGGDDDGADGTQQPAPALAERWSRCVHMRTLDGDGSGENREGRGDSLLTRRLGLIIGSCMGCVVFAALVVILVYTKVKKQRRNAKHQQPLPPEYLSYRHFSLQGCEQSTVLGRSIAATNLVSVALR